MTSTPAPQPEPDPKPSFWKTLGLGPEFVAAAAELQIGERPPVELPAERRAHVATRAAEFQEWVAGGLTRQEALTIVGTEIQLEMRLKHDSDRRRDGG